MRLSRFVSIFVLILVLSSSRAEQATTQCKLELYQVFPDKCKQEACWYGTEALPYCWNYFEPCTLSFQKWSFQYHEQSYHHVKNKTLPNSNFEQGKFYSCSFDIKDPSHSLQIDITSDSTGNVETIGKALGFIALGIFMCCAMVFGKSDSSPSTLNQDLNLDQLVIEQKDQAQINQEIQQTVKTIVNP